MGDNTTQSFDSFGYVDGAGIPPEYASALEDVAPGIVDATNQTATGGSWIDNLQKVMTALVMTDQQRKLLNINLERAKQGKPPIDATSYGPGVNVGLNSDTQKLLYYAGIGVIGFLVWKELKKR